MDAAVYERQVHDLEITAGIKQVAVLERAIEEVRLFYLENLVRHVLVSVDFHVSVPFGSARHIINKCRAKHPAFYFSVDAGYDCRGSKALISLAFFLA